LSRSIYNKRFSLNTSIFGFNIYHILFFPRIRGEMPDFPSCQCPLVVVVVVAAAAVMVVVWLVVGVLGLMPGRETFPVMSIQVLGSIRLSNAYLSETGH
jgi:hypothetical protein